jgi:CheY-like chemotaxis protein
VLERAFQQAGFDVRVEKDSAPGVETFRTWQPQLIWINLRLPVMGGLEDARRIRKENGKDGKIVAVSASLFGFRHAEALGPGFDRLVHLSFQREVLESMAWQHDVG